MTQADHYRALERRFPRIRLSLENAINFFDAGHGNLSLHLPSLPEMLRR
jgi:hypothetical protein